MTEEGPPTSLRVVYPIKHYKDEGFVERKIEFHEEDLAGILEDYLLRHGDFEFDEIEIVNERPIDIWFHAKCRKYIDTEASAEEQKGEVAEAQAEVEIPGAYDGNKYP